MLLVDSLYINNSGGKILLDYLVQEFEKARTDVFYLFDERCSTEFIDIAPERKLFLKSSILGRINFYRINKHRFTKVFCFGNFPPPIKLDIPTYTYYHNVLILNIPSKYSLLQKIKSFARKTYFLYLLKNTSNIIVQSDLVKGDFKGKFDYKKIHIIPFYHIMAGNRNEVRNTQFLYVAASLPHKNHKTLLEAWELLPTQNYYPELHLTISEKSAIHEVVTQLTNKNIRIINHGYLEPSQLLKLYQTSEYLVFPSLTESFGLPLIEACSYGCKVIASDMNYVHKVIEPSRTFDPYSAESIAETVVSCYTQETKPTKLKVENRIKHIISLLDN